MLLIRNIGVIIYPFMIRLFLGLFLLLQIASSARYTQNLSQWTFRVENTTRDYPAVIPSTLALDLVENKLISNDPYYRDNFLQFYAYETKDAVYRTTFNLTAAQIASQHQFLIFQGLDTHAEVTLNGQPILSAHNMFRRWEVAVKFNKTNELVVNFTSSAKYDLLKEKEFKQEYGFGLPQNYSFTRKAAYQYGWDWGPRILTVGIWKEVKVVLYNDSRIDNVRFLHSHINKTTKNISCEVKVEVDHLDSTASYSLALAVRRQANNATIHVENLTIKATVKSSLDFAFTITNNIWDCVWWTWDLGEPNLLSVSLTLTNQRSQQVITSSMTTGIRSVSVVQESKSFNGTSFTFNLNGYDVYMRGGNYIPPEMSMPKANLQTYLRVKEDALFARFNMIRLWGGGQFENDDFYATMDQAGILIWHDLMFACALYPSSPDILDNIASEMRDNVRRIRHHPSIGLWNGNNEVWIGWQEWGWQNNLTALQKQQVETMYNDVFRVTLPNVLRQEHPEVYYWETSPSVSSWTTKNINSGDIHFWRVWGAGTPIEEYEEFVGRFNSEYGMQAMPEISSIQQYTRPTDLTTDFEVLKLHERHPMGEVYLPGYTWNYTLATGNITRLAYFSQVMQAWALEKAITSLRLSKPFNMGSLYWQLNDVWPVTSWATVDYYGSYKAGHYWARRSYDQLMMHTQHDRSSGDYVTYIVNDYNRTFNCHCVLTIFTFAGEATKVKHVIEKAIKPFDKILVHRFNKTEYGNFTNNAYLRTELRTADNLVSNNHYFFVPMKSWPIADPMLTYTFQGSSIHLKAQKLATYVWIYRKRNENYLGMRLEDNYFHLAPGEEKIVSVGTVPHAEIFVTCYELEVIQEKNRQKHLSAQ